MPRGKQTAIRIVLSAQERTTLAQWQRSTALPAGLARRGRLLLLVSAGTPLVTAAQIAGLGRHVVYKWIARYQARGLQGLYDLPGRGRRGRPTARGNSGGDSRCL